MERETSIFSTQHTGRDGMAGMLEIECTTPGQPFGLTTLTTHIKRRSEQPDGVLQMPGSPGDGGRRSRPRQRERQRRELSYATPNLRHYRDARKNDIVMTTATGIDPLFHCSFAHPELVHLSMDCSATGNISRVLSHRASGSQPRRFATFREVVLLRSRGKDPSGSRPRSKSQSPQTVGERMDVTSLRSTGVPRLWQKLDVDAFIFPMPSDCEVDLYLLLLPGNAI
jgi:hypothetical protein